MTKKALLVATAVAVILSSAPAEAQLGARPGVRRELGYFLPRVRAGAVVHELILRCPTDDDPRPVIATNVDIAGKARPDPARFIRVNANSGFLSARTTKLGLRADGTLTSFNATTEGQGGEVLSAVIGLATTVASFGFGVPIPAATGHAGLDVPPRLHCNPTTAERVARRSEIETELTRLRSRVATGGESAASAEVLAELTAELADLVGQLTLETSTTFNPNRSDFEASSGTPPSAQSKGLAPVDYHSWFTETGDVLQQRLETAKVAGRHGYLATLTPDRIMFDNFAGDGRAFPGPGEATPFLFYRRPVPATVTVTSCSTGLGGSHDPDAVGNQCTIESGPDAISKSETVLLPQLSGPFSIPIGSGGIFGTRAAAATFDEQGAPLTLEYGATSGGSAIAGVINSAGTAVTTLRDAETAAITRRLAREKAQHDLNELLDAPESATAAH